MSQGGVKRGKRGGLKWERRGMRLRREIRGGGEGEGRVGGRVKWEKREVGGS